MLDATGAVLSQQRYYPFGGARLDPGVTQTDFSFTGQRGTDFGLMDYRARFYSSRLGRFTQPDTLIPDPANPQSFNRYSYVQNSPLNFVDPSGHWPLGPMVEGICPPSVCKNNPALLDNKLYNEDQWKREIVIRRAEIILGNLGGKNDLEAMAQIADWGATIYGDDWNSGILPTLTEIFVGVETTGPLTLVDAGLINKDGCAGLGRETRDCEANRGKPQFADTGFHKDFRDTHNQPFHAWANIVNVATPGNQFMGGVGVGIGVIANIAHDIGQSVLNIDEGFGTSWEDYVLSYASWDIGKKITELSISPSQLADKLRSTLGPNGPGSGGRIQIYYQIFGPLAGSP